MGFVGKIAKTTENPAIKYKSLKHSCLYLVFHRFSILFIDLITIHEVLPDNQGIRRGTDIPFQRATIRDLAPQFGKEKERKTDRRNARGNGWLTVHEFDRFQSYYRRYRNSENRNGSNN